MRPLAAPTLRCLLATRHGAAGVLAGHTPLPSVLLRSSFVGRRRSRGAKGALHGYPCLVLPPRTTTRCCCCSCGCRGCFAPTRTQLAWGRAAHTCATRSHADRCFAVPASGFAHSCGRKPWSSRVHRGIAPSPGYCGVSFLPSCGEARIHVGASKLVNGSLVRWRLVRR